MNVFRVPKQKIGVNIRIEYKKIQLYKSAQLIIKFFIGTLRIEKNLFHNTIRKA